MNTTTKVALNTIILYTKIIISMIISLVSVPLVLKALGASDYGLYSLIAGVVAMLSFLNNSMTVSSQRYMSVAMGTNNVQTVNIVFNTSFWLHIIIGALVFAFLEFGTFFIDNLNIEPERLTVAHLLYQFLIVSTLIKIISVPFDAIINAREDMLVFSIIELLESFLMLALALSLSFLRWDRLLFYGFGVLIISLITTPLKYFWTKFAYKDYHINLRRYWKELRTKEMIDFAGWNLFGALALMGRNQGVSVVINLFQGTVANAAYGVANQINGVLVNFSATFQKAINPQLMKSEGMNDRDRLLKISYISSKFSVLAICFFAIPLIVEIDDVLTVWLKNNIPPYTMELSCCILMLSILFQLSVGIMSAIQAVGKIRNYQITMGLILLLNVPLSYLIIRAGYPIYYATASFVVLEFISFLIRLLFGKRIAGISISNFFRIVLFPVVFITIISAVLCLIPHFCIYETWPRLIITCITYGVSFLLLVWFFAFNKEQRDSILSHKMISQNKK